MIVCIYAAQMTWGNQYKTCVITSHLCLIKLYVCKCCLYICIAKLTPVKRVELPKCTLQLAAAGLSSNLQCDLIQFWPLGRFLGCFSIASTGVCFDERIIIIWQVTAFAKHSSDLIQTGAQIHDHSGRSYSKVNALLVVCTRNIQIQKNTSETSKHWAIAGCPTFTERSLQSRTDIVRAF